MTAELKLAILVALATLYTIALNLYARTLKLPTPTRPA
jgi:hypothetical protein